ncbi:hypothetical protein GDO86_019089, partial [Hymenochirus boettgeri]
DFYKYYTSENLKTPVDEEVDVELKKDLLKHGNKVTETEVDKHGGFSLVVQILKKMWPMALSVCLVFTVTIGVFPSVTVDVKSTIAGDSDWGE